MYRLYVPFAFLRNNSYILSIPKLFGRWGLYPFESSDFFPPCIFFIAKMLFVFENMYVFETEW